MKTKTIKIEYTGRLRIVIRNGDWILQQEVIETEDSGASAIYWKSVEIIHEDEGYVYTPD